MTHPSRLLRRFQTWAGVALLSVLAACSTLDRGQPPALERGATWAVLPFANHTETPLAGHRAEAIAEALLQAEGVGSVKPYQGTVRDEALFDAGQPQRQEAALAWARQQKVRYVLTGAVDEWRYKVGVDGEPAAGVTLKIVDVASGETVWSGAGGKSGWSREALSAVAQKLIRDLLKSGLSGLR
ncbi:MAG TPA: penicillin-binding protein activator LpoB [Aquabacterium sp.]|nr:penicillin-binding protein activator LpoB [Aquabacterium sp.]